MLPSFFLSLREGLEAVLVICITLGALRQMKRQELNPAIWRGVLSAVIACLLAAFTLNLLGTEFEGKAEAIFEGFTMILAAMILTWMIFWMRHQAGSNKRNLEAKVRLAVLRNGSKALFLLAFLAVGREGLELSLFLVATRLTSGGLQTIVGTAFGLASATLIGWLLYTSALHLSLKRFFQVTNVLLILFAAGLLAHGVYELSEAGIIPPLIEHVYSISFLLSDQSTIGGLLRALFGYNDNPSLAEVIAYLGYFLLLALTSVRINRVEAVQSAAD